LKIFVGKIKGASRDLAIGVDVCTNLQHSVLKNRSSAIFKEKKLSHKGDLIREEGAWKRFQKTA